MVKMRCAMLLFAVAMAMSAMMVTATIVPVKEILDHVISKQESGTFKCNLDLSYAITADYPQSSDMIVNYSYNGTDDCASNRAETDSITVPLGNYFDNATDYGLTVKSFVTDSSMTAKINVDLLNINSLASGTIAVKITGASDESSEATNDQDVTCKTMIVVDYNLDYNILLTGGRPTGSGSPTVSKNDVTVTCKDKDGNDVPFNESFVDGIMEYSGISATNTFNGGAYLGVASAFLGAVPGSLASVKTDIEDQLRQEAGTEGPTSTTSPTSTTGATTSPQPTTAPVCVETSYIDMHGLERVHEEDTYSEVFCISGSTLPCGTADHLLDISGVYVSYRTYCQTHTCTQKMAYVNGIKHSQASRLVHDGELKLTTMTDRTGTFGLYMTGLMQRNGVLLNVLDRFQRHEYI